MTTQDALKDSRINPPFDRREDFDPKLDKLLAELYDTTNAACSKQRLAYERTQSSTARRRYTDSLRLARERFAALHEYRSTHGCPASAELLIEAEDEGWYPIRLANRTADSSKGR
jgi:hypothetical protein